MALTIVPALDVGRPIRTNIPLDHDEILTRYPAADIGGIDVDDPDVWDSFPHGCLVVLDEVGSVFPSGVKASTVNPRAREWIAMHRHRVGPVGDAMLSMEIVLISQGSTDIAAFIRSKVDKTYVIMKLDAVGAERRYRCDVYQGWQDTARPLKRMHIRGYVGKYQDCYTALYVSHTQADADVVDVKELRADKDSSVWDWKMKASLAGPVFSLLAIWYALSHVDFFLGSEQVEQVQQVEQVEQVEQVQQVQQVEQVEQVQQVQQVEQVQQVQQVEQSEERSLSDWRLSAYVELHTGPKSGSNRVILTRGQDRRFLRDVDCELRSGERWCRVDGDEWASEHTGRTVDVWAAVDPDSDAVDVRVPDPASGIEPGFLSAIRDEEVIASAPRIVPRGTVSH
ncbi:zonular occludens toxin domain-containing protein [Marichromatium gracile]|nr:zonular occludens toxin domain-containing protein [Marichromatium gracile]